MRAIRLRFMAAAAALTVAFTGVLPAQAFQMPSAPVAVQSSAAQIPGVTDIQYRDRDNRWRPNDRDRRYGDRRMVRDGYYNGHRGYRERRNGYRYHNGYWFPLAAFGAGAIIGGAIQAPRAVPRAGYSTSHYAWCENRYKTYRASDNSYVASAGVRRVCNSPY